MGHICEGLLLSVGGVVVICVCLREVLVVAAHQPLWFEGGGGGHLMGWGGSSGLWIVVVVSPVLKMVACVGRELLLPVGIHCLWVGCCCTGSSSMCGVISVCRCSLSMGIVCGCLLFAGGGSLLSVDGASLG